ncbi:MAG: hypothetical protein ABIH23_31755 [bacterium]
MVEAIPTAIQQVLATTEAYPTYLFVIYDSNGDAWRRFAASKTAVVFPSGGGGDTYYPRHFSFQGISNDPVVTRFQIEMSNFGDTYNDADNGDMIYYHTQVASLVGLRFVVWEVYRTSADVFPSDSSDKIIVLDGTIVTVSFSYGKCLLTVGSKYQLNHVRLWRCFQTTCPFAFGDSDCNRDSLFYLSGAGAGAKLYDTGYVKSGQSSPYTSLELLLDDALTQRDEPDNYWLYGSITVGTETKRIIGWDSTTYTATLDIGFSSDPSGEAYTIQKGCSKDWITCCGNNNWGPSLWNDPDVDAVDNSYNFGGFAHMKADV